MAGRPRCLFRCFAFALSTLVLPALAGCATQPSPQPSIEASPETSELAPLASPMPIVSPTPTRPPDLPTPQVGSQPVTILYEGLAQVEISGPTGRRVLVDIRIPAKLSAPPRGDDILLATTLRPEFSVQQEFVNEFPGESLIAEAADIQTSDVKVTSIPSTMFGSVPGSLDNFIYVVEIGGLRIAHFGWISQETLSQEQLTALGPVDIAIAVLDPSTLNLMEQVRPKVLIPVSSHMDPDAVRQALTAWPSYCGHVSSASITPAMLPLQTSVLLIDEDARRPCR
jgi:hypothetical protein